MRSINMRARIFKQRNRNKTRKRIPSTSRSTASQRASSKTCTTKLQR